MTPSTAARPILRTMRPRQWSKNLLVLAAPLAAGVVGESGVLQNVLVAFVAFCLCASGIYLCNDVVDAEADAIHPRKRLRPVASGELSARLALVCGVMLLLFGVGLAFVGGVALGTTLATYVLLQLCYALWLKHQPVIDLAVVSSGFLLRAIAGGVAADVPLSQWFLLVASFGSLFMVAGKRYSELRALGQDSATRRSLALYSESYLRFVWSLAAAVTVTAYSLWAFEMPSSGSVDLEALSIAPFVMAMLRYAVDIDKGVAEEPEEAVVRDPVLLVLGAVWLGIFAVAVYSG